MEKLRIAIIASVVTIALILVFFFLVGVIKPKKAKMIIESTPSAQVYLSGEAVGETPLEQSLDASEIVLKLTPTTQNQFASYETKLSLKAGTTTIVRRFFGESGESSSGELITLEKNRDQDSSLSLVSIPDSAQITFDGQPKGFTPQNIANLTAGSHLLKIAAAGYKERTFSLELISGYRLIVSVNLSPLPRARPPEEQKEKIEILATPTGFLRVRQEADKNSKELGQVMPGETYEFLEETEGWFKIKLSDGTEGWVSSEYAQKLP